MVNIFLKLLKKIDKISNIYWLVPVRVASAGAPYNEKRKS